MCGVSRRVALLELSMPKLKTKFILPIRTGALSLLEHSVELTLQSDQKIEHLEIQWSVGQQSRLDVQAISLN